ncbi:MAG: sulfite exporter TauE/SafE family protein [Pseudomonadota bacterium]
MLDPGLLALVAITFLIAGCVKGVVGFGLPTVALALLAATFGLKPAIALTVFPSLLTNLWQALSGGHLRTLMVRLAPLILAVLCGVFLGTRVLASASPAPLTLVLGVLLLVYATLGLAKVVLPLIGDRERWASPLVGLVNGSITGLTGTFIVPGVMYLQSLGLERSQLVQAMGLLFCISTLALGGFLVQVALLPADMALTSFLAVIPAFIGMWLGQKIGARLNDVLFQRLLFIGLGAVGVFLAIRSLIVLAN